MMNKITAIAYVKAKGEPMTFTQEAMLIMQGLEGDYHTKLEGKRADGLVVIVSAPLLEWMEQASIKGLCFRRFKYNICLFQSISKLKKGEVLSLGQAKLQMSTRHKPCFAAKQPCQIASPQCKLLHEMKFAQILQEGKIAVSDVLA